MYVNKWPLQCKRVTEIAIGQLDRKLARIIYDSLACCLCKLYLNLSRWQVLSSTEAQVKEIINHRKKEMENINTDLIYYN